MATPRILLCGDVLGHLKQLFKRVLSVNKSSGPFDALLCVGQFFPDSLDHLEEFNDYIEALSAVPIPTYFIGDYGVGAPKVLSAASKDFVNLGFKMDGLRICENLYWLKGSGKFTVCGLVVAYLSGRQLASGQLFGNYTQDDVDALRALADEPGIVDIFLTNEWPFGVTNRAAANNVPPGVSDSSGGDSVVSELVSAIKPRYHVAGSQGVFYAREPYANVNAVHVTRFFGLAPIGNKDKQVLFIPNSSVCYLPTIDVFANPLFPIWETRVLKFIHAISPIPSAEMTAAQICMKPPDTTPSPFTFSENEASTRGSMKRSDDSPDTQYWRYDMSKRQKNENGDGSKLCFKFASSGSCSRGEKCYFQHDEGARQQYMRGVCFDFLNKGTCERGPGCTFEHSLLEEGESLSKRRAGPGNENLNRSKDCWFCLSSANLESHLITSIGENYYCAIAKGPLVQDHVLIIPIEHSPNTLSSSPHCEIELTRVQNNLKAYFKNQGKEVIFFEWIFKRGTHANLQAVPIPSSRASAVQDIFNLAAKKLGFKWISIEGDGNSEGRKMLRMQFDRSCSLFYVELPGGTILSHVVEENEKFPVQFGREVLAGLLNVADKADWKNCKLSKDEETRMAESFRNGFEECKPAL